MIRQAVGEEIVSHTRKVHTQRDPKKEKQLKSKAKSKLIIFFDIKGTVHKELILADQTVNPAYTVTFMATT
jgi:hypothetical protein